jgi:hypothetical protein
LAQPKSFYSTNVEISLFFFFVAQHFQNKSCQLSCRIPVPSFLFYFIALINTRLCCLATPLLFPFPLRRLFFSPFFNIAFSPNQPARELFIVSHRT